MNYDESTIEELNGSHLQGTITATPYHTLVKIFGEPHDYRGHRGEKIDVEWMLKFADGTVASIYNWKYGINYLQNSGTPVEQISQWNVGGHSRESYAQVLATVLGHKETQPSLF